VKARSGDVKDRQVSLEPRAIRALQQQAAIANTGPVFRRRNGTPWNSDTILAGAQVNREFQKIAKGAGIDRHVFLHMIRHSWATWHYCVHQDLKKLREDGAWESLEMADRYSHLAPSGMREEILAFWGRDQTLGDC
jgi:integrase